MSSIVNHRFEYLSEQGDNFIITRKKDWSTDVELREEDIEKCVKFAYDMMGKHREHRSGGLVTRKDTDILFDVVRGKFGEFGFYNRCRSKGKEMSYPDLEVNEKGIWDSGDFTLKDTNIAVKSTKHFGNLLLLEQKDWDYNGRYIPDIGKSNECTYDFIYLVRVCSNFEKIYCDYKGSKENVLKNLSYISVKINIAGYITHNDLVNEIIRKKYIIPQGSKLNKKILMDADNYYVQAHDLR